MKLWIKGGHSRCHAFFFLLSITTTFACFLLKYRTVALQVLRLLAPLPSLLRHCTFNKKGVLHAYWPIFPSCVLIGWRIMVAMQNHFCYRCLTGATINYNSYLHFPKYKKDSATKSHFLKPPWSSLSQQIVPCLVGYKWFTAFKNVVRIKILRFKSRRIRTSENLAAQVTIAALVQWRRLKLDNPILSSHILDR